MHSKSHAMINECQFRNVCCVFSSTHTDAMKAVAAAVLVTLATLNIASAGVFGPRRK